VAVYVTFLASWTGCIKVDIIWIIPAQSPEYHVCWLNILDVCPDMRLNIGGNIIAGAADIFQKIFLDVVIFIYSTGQVIYIWIKSTLIYLERVDDFHGRFSRRAEFVCIYWCLMLLISECVYIGYSCS